MFCTLFFFSSRRRHTRWTGDWSSDVCSSDLISTKKLAIHALKDGGTKEQEIEPGRQNEQVLSDAQILQLERMGRKIEERSEERRVGKECRSGWSRCGAMYT